MQHVIEILSNEKGIVNFVVETSVSGRITIRNITVDLKTEKIIKYTPPDNTLDAREEKFELTKSMQCLWYCLHEGKTKMGICFGV